MAKKSKARKNPAAPRNKSATSSDKPTEIGDLETELLEEDLLQDDFDELLEDDLLEDDLPDNDLAADTPAPTKLAPTKPVSKAAKKISKKKPANKKPRAKVKKSEALQTTKVPRKDAAGRPYRNLDEDRKLTKAQRGKLEVWRGKNRIKEVDSFFASQLSATQKEKGHPGAFVSTAESTMLMGIPINSLAFEYVIGQSAFPLGIIMQLVGEPGSCKSALFYEFCHWFRENGGNGTLFETEGKYSLELLESIITTGHEHEPRRAGVRCHPCMSLEGWQQALTQTIKALRTKMEGTKEDPGPGRSIPVVFGVDSLAGRLSEESQEQILKEGSASRSFPVEALYITRYMQCMPNLLLDWPFTVVLVNHLKPGTDKMGFVTRNKPGGRGVTFQESFEIETRKIRLYKAGPAEGKVINLRCYKNSFAPGDRRADTRMYWWFELDEETGKQVQKTKWDWGWATVSLLSKLQGQDKKRFDEQGLHIATPTVSIAQNTAWSRSLGMTKADAMPWSELGDLIHESPDLMYKCRKALGIKMIPELAGDYVQQQERIAEDMQ